MVAGVRGRVLTKEERIDEGETKVNAEKNCKKLVDQRWRGGDGDEFMFVLWKKKGRRSDVGGILF